MQKYHLIYVLHLQTITQDDGCGMAERKEERKIVKRSDIHSLVSHGFTRAAIWSQETADVMFFSTVFELGGCVGKS